MERYCIEHSTVYGYGSAVSVAQQLVRLQPRPLPWQRCLAFELSADPLPHSISLENDYFGNPTRTLGFTGAHHTLTLLARSVVEVDERPWARAGSSGSPPWEQVRSLLSGSGEALVSEFRFASSLVRPFVPAATFARGFFTPGRPLLEACDALMQGLYARFQYAPGETDSESSVAEVWASRKGVCQDFAHIMIAALRGLGLAARYVSGYLRTDPPAGRPRLVGSDASHAWVAVWCPRWGWVEFDPTNCQRANADYVVLGWGRDFADVSPVRGVITGSSAHKLVVQVTVWPDSERLLSPARGRHTAETGKA